MESIDGTQNVQDAGAHQQQCHRSVTSEKRSKRPPKRNSHPLQKGISDFIENRLSPSALSSRGLSPEGLLVSLPKRYTVYQPLLLLPANAFTSPPVWGSLYDSLDDHERQKLYESIATSFHSTGVTHIAINAPIELTDKHGGENRMRSPTGLLPLYGDFGPLPRPKTDISGGTEAQPVKEDFDKALWVRTRQNGGIVQTWAPLYTMFSRGNISEKARILGQGNRFDGLGDDTLKGERIQDISVVDMFAGIGYFVFSYLKRGVKRVWGWELNAWSVEGLRRGCMENGWDCRVVTISDDGMPQEPYHTLVDGLRDTDRVVIFHGDNKFAAQTLDRIRMILEERKSWNSVRHVNLGLLPTSQPAWENAYRLLDRRYGGWLHVHENVDIRQIEKKREDILDEFRRLSIAVDEKTMSPQANLIECHHVEQVKTYAPGVMHCVYDIEISFSSEGSAVTIPP
jgi:tRNA wybutosine-synthesizing protein 2